MGHGYHYIKRTIPGLLHFLLLVTQSYGCRQESGIHIRSAVRARFGLFLSEHRTHVHSFLLFHVLLKFGHLGCAGDFVRDREKKCTSTLLFVYGVRGPKEWCLLGHEGQSFVFPTQCHHPYCPRHEREPRERCIPNCCLSLYMKLVQSLSLAGYPGHRIALITHPTWYSGFSVILIDLESRGCSLWRSCD